MLKNKKICDLLYKLNILKIKLYKNLFIYYYYLYLYLFYLMDFKYLDFDL